MHDHSITKHLLVYCINLTPAQNIWILGFCYRYIATDIIVDPCINLFLGKSYMKNIC